MVRRNVPVKNLKPGEIEAAVGGHGAAGDHAADGHPDRGRPRDRQVPQGPRSSRRCRRDPGRPGAHLVAIEGRAAGGDGSCCASRTSASPSSSGTTDRDASDARRRPPPAVRSRRAVGHVPLARALSKLGLATRTEASALIVAGRVAVDGRVVRDPRARSCRSASRSPSTASDRGATAEPHHRPAQAARTW